MWKKIIVSGSDAELNSVSGDGSGLYNVPSNIAEIEINFGNTPAKMGNFVITGSNFTPNTPIIINQSVGPYTNKGSMMDEFQMDSINISGKCISDTFIKCYWKSNTFVKGNFKFNYIWR